MIYSVIAFPGRLSEWCERLVYDLAATAPRKRITDSKAQPSAAQPELAMIYADSLAHIGLQLLKRGCLGAVIVSREPHAALCRALSETSRPFLLVLDDPATSVAALMRDRQFEYLKAVRLLSNATMSFLELVSKSNALVLRAEGKPNFEAIAGKIARHFGFETESTAIETVLAKPHMQTLAARVHEAPDMRRLEQESLLPQLPAMPQTSIIPDDPFIGHRLTPLPDGAIEPFWRALQGQELHDIVWSRELFFCKDKAGEAPVRPISLTGPGRCLIFGPYLRLPGGPWSCRVTFGCDDRAIGTDMVADAYAGAVLGRARFRLTEPGIFEIEFPFDNGNPDIPVEIRLFNTNAALDGQITLGEVRLSPLEFKRLPVTR